MQIGSFIEASNQARNMQELFGLYKAAMTAYGYDRIVFSLMTDHASIGRRAGHGIASNYPQDWMKFYAEKWYALIDPVRQYVYYADGPFSWDSLPRHRKLTQPQLECLRLAAEAGLRDGIGVPLRGPAGALAGIGAASSAGGVAANAGILSCVHLLSQQFYSKFLALERKPQAAAILLSQQEREVLKWCAAGKTRQEMAVIIGISESSIKTYLRRAQIKLGATNATAAAFQAIQFGLI